MPKAKVRVLHTDEVAAKTVVEAAKSSPKALTEENIRLLVDRATELDVQVKGLSSELGDIKKIVLDYCQKNKVSEIRGSTGLVKCGSSSSTTTGTVTQFAALLKKEGKSNLLNDLVSVRLTDAKKYLGEEALKGFLTVVTTPFSRLSFKPIKK